MGEKWRPIVDYEKTYEVSDQPRVRRIVGGRGARAGRILKQCPDSHGRMLVCLCLCGKQRTFLVSHLVANAFLPAKSPTDTVVRHLNDDPTDDRAVNLARGTRSDNVADAIRNGKWHPSKGSSHSNAKLTEDDVIEIHRLYATGEFWQRELARRFGVSQSLIGKIILWRAWKHVREE
jgi:hypothetical protein